MSSLIDRGLRPKDFPFEDQIELCKCLHLITGHTLLKGKCGYDYCNCEEFIFCEIELETEIEIEEKLDYKGGIF